MGKESGNMGLCQSMKSHSKVFLKVSAMAEKPKIKVYYNSACPVCNTGIKWQMAKPAACDIQWNDIHRDNLLVDEINSDLEFVRERLHVVDEHGNVAVGFDAFLAIWRGYPKETWKAKLFGLPVIRQVCGLAYNYFAAKLYRWNTSKRRW
jgi:predicted DCC family thiol-disulfide oxidoreductase YuxK